jgi:hypothetical protein
MAGPVEIETIGDDEYIYRRIPVSAGWYDPAKAPVPSPEAFRPLKQDVSGLSAVRARFVKTIEDAAKGPSRKGYYVAVLRAGDLRQKGIEVVSRPEEGNPGHAEIPGLTYGNRETDRPRNYRSFRPKS